ncbi:PD-(D/E)XK nuclease family protein [Polaribacter litorisediminis]|uniref:PD-(D/E)XK nuclease family protein n=1 Tax=Polaribacter litorisediminis TaxID=1908341 RepID=UPI001CBBD813|nr:PD-(D/E)XK nuclease family protein [Polaribacter litorisediminis]UAM97442.1 PD-(D/E)XK nuclease family protein [Polaribacter litorisediminis]
MNFNSEQLQTFLNQNEIPKIKRKPKTFLGIAKQPHYENVLSNMYAFYFNVNEVHKLKDLFVSSLLELINLESKQIETFFDFEVFTELGVSDQKRIDILLHNNDQAIIIENKVYHHLNNDLDLYYKDVKATNKIGVILSLKTISRINHPHFINITHLQLLKQVMSNLGNYLLDANDKYVVFLKDLYQNIINLSTDAMNTNDIEFYLKNRNNIHYTARFLNRFKEHVKQQVEQACHILNDNDEPFLKLNNTGGRLRYFTSIKLPNLMFTIVFGELYEDDKKRIYMVVELKGEALEGLTRYKNIDFTSDEMQILNDDFYTKKHIGWAHFAGIGYYLEKKEIYRLVI